MLPAAAHIFGPFKGLYLRIVLIFSDQFKSSHFLRAKAREIWVHSFGHILTKKHEISQAFALRKRELLNWYSFGRFF
jgi:hypothetical protein